MPVTSPAFSLSTDEDEEKEEQKENEPAQPSAKPADVARAALHASASKLVRRMAGATALQRPPSPGHKRPPGADPNAIVVDFDGDGLARHLLEMFDFEPRPPK
jgi:hypothetical protein